MKIKFTKFERIAGIFVLAAIAGALFMTLAVGVKKGWFSPKVQLYTVFEKGDGLYPGTAVQIAGLRAGSVDDVELTGDNHIKVIFSVKENFFRRLRTDSEVQVLRPFVIGEKILDVTVGGEAGKPLHAGAQVLSKDSTDLLEILSGRNLGANLNIMAKVMDNLRVVAEAFTDPARTESLVKTFDQINPLVTNMNEMSRQVIILSKKLNHGEDLQRSLANVAILTNELNKIIPSLNEESPTFGKDMARMSSNMVVLTDELAKLLPILQDIAPELPHASHRAIEALDEAVVTLKAMQKSFLIRGAAKEVREEEKSQAEKQEKQQELQPAEDRKPAGN